MTNKEITCKNCGAMIEDVGSYCPKCGSPIVRNTDENMETSDTAKDRDTSFVEHITESGLPKISFRGIDRWTIALVIAVLSSVASFYAFSGNANGSSPLLFLGFTGSLISYALAGGILTAVRWSFGLGKWGWLLVPIFPFDLCIGFCALVFGFFAFLFLPIFIVGKRFLERREQQLIIR